MKNLSKRTEICGFCRIFKGTFYGYCDLHETNVEGDQEACLSWKPRIPESFTVKAWINEENVVNCLSQVCKLGNEVCPRFDTCKKYEIKVREII